MARPAQLDEIKEFFKGVDVEVCWDIYMADLCYVDVDRFYVDDLTRLMAFIMRRVFPAGGED